ncbi:MAG: hypothetical protein M0R46_09910 [Candidatus Muirbacterium halophilum]|nr:hypothetical protein [Candidatus Muirbacterium halophilum]
MNKSKIFIPLIVLLSIGSYAQNQLPIPTQTQAKSTEQIQQEITQEPNNIANNVINSQANSANNVIDSSSTQPAEFVDPNQKKVIYAPNKSYTNEKIFVYKQNMNMNNVKTKFYVEQSKNSSFVPTSLITAKNNQMIAYNQNQQTQRYYNQRVASAIKATCIVSDDVMVADNSQMMKVLCKTSKGNFIDLVMNLIPNNQGFSLTAIPQHYIDSSDNFVQIDPKMSYITNHSGSSNNIATYINTQQLRKNVNSFGSGVAGGLGKASNLAIDQLRQSMTTQESTIISGGDGIAIVQDTNTRRPTSDDYRDYGIIGLASGVVQGISKVADNLTQNDLPWLYYIKKGSVLNVYLTPNSLTTQQQQQTQFNIKNNR